jgi:hypothetical protein
MGIISAVKTAPRREKRRKGKNYLKSFNGFDCQILINSKNFGQSHKIYDFKYALRTLRLCEYFFS